jgi:SAM-dependent methyltransferase
MERKQYEEGQIAVDRVREAAAVHDNLENWEDRAEVHFNGGYGDIDAMIRDSHAISPVVRRDLEVLQPFLIDGSVNGKRLLHLQCHIGTDTLSWWRLGARDVHGLDFSPSALDHARDIARRAGAQISYVEGDARYAVQAMPGERFDVIVTSAGTITWLPDLRDWARSIADLLVPGGVFMIRDNHPLLFALDNSGLNVIESYMSGNESFYETDESYTQGSAGKIAHTRNHNWAHDFQEMTSVLLDAGLVIESVGEHEETDWQALPMLEFDDESQSWRMPQGSPRIPLTFSIVARKPQE